MRLLDPRDGVDPEKPNNAGPLTMLGGALAVVVGAGTLVGSLLGESIHPARQVLGALALVLGVLVMVWGRARWKAWSAGYRALGAAIPESDRLDEGLCDPHERLAASLGGTLVRARAVALQEALQESVAGERCRRALQESDEARNDPERHDRVSFVREAVPQLAYRSYQGRRTRTDTGPGVVEQAYWRVRADLPPLAQEFHIVGRHLGHALLAVLGAPPATLGDAVFDRVFVLHMRDPEWLRAHLTPELRAVLLRHPRMLLRAHRGRVEALWPAAPTHQTLSRFSEASTLVTALARALSGQPRTPFR